MKCPECTYESEMSKVEYDHHIIEDVHFCKIHGLYVEDSGFHYQIKKTLDEIKQINKDYVESCITCGTQCVTCSVRKEILSKFEITQTTKGNAK